jgi:hypothetical protein
MIVYLEPLYGDVQGNLDRAKAETEKALGFRGTITRVKAKGNQIQVVFKVNPQWDLPLGEKMTYLADWLPVRVRHFKVTCRLLEKA